jgi:hypothetical protein
VLDYGSQTGTVGHRAIRPGARGTAEPLNRQQQQSTRLENKMADLSEALGPDEAPPLQKERQVPATALERRVDVRYYYTRRPAAAYGVRGGVCEGDAVLHDISRGGVALVAPRGIEPGTELFVGLPTADSGVTLTQLARVIHARRLGPLHWLIGCEFLSRLSEGDLERVLEKSG